MSANENSNDACCVWFWQPEIHPFAAATVEGFDVMDTPPLRRFTLPSLKRAEK